MKVVIATNNKHKVEEIETALDFPGWEFLTLSQVESYPEPEEDADTFVGNALIKARAAHEATGMAALADDSGLVVPRWQAGRVLGALCGHAWRRCREQRQGTRRA